MAQITREEITAYVAENIQSFHKRRLESLAALKLAKVLKSKNPYLYRAKNIVTAGELVKTILDAHLSSQEEGIFGGFLEGLAVFINGKVYGGRKSAAEGIDLEFEKDAVVYFVTIKSGPKWANADQVSRMKDNFARAKRIRRTNVSNVNVVCVNGCCYGRQGKEDKGEYLKLCGQRFWEFISGDEQLYIDIIEPLGHQAKERNDEFLVAYAEVVNQFTKEFMNEYCTADGRSIDWPKIAKLNSGAIAPKNPTATRKKL